MLKAVDYHEPAHRRQGVTSLSLSIGVEGVAFTPQLQATMNEAIPNLEPHHREDYLYRNTTSVTLLIADSAIKFCLSPSQDATGLCLQRCLEEA